MNNDNNNPQTPDPNMQKLENDLQKIASEGATINQPIQEQKVVVQEPVSQPRNVPPPPPNVPVDTGKKSFSMMTVAMIFLIVAIVVAIGYVGYVKFIAPPVPTPSPIETQSPTIEPLPIDTSPASDSAVQTTSPLPDAAASPSDSPTPLATP